MSVSPQSEGPVKLTAYVERIFRITSDDLLALISQSASPTHSQDHFSKGDL